MTIKQISVQLANIPGQLAKLVDILDKEDISAKAISAASTAESSVVRLVVNDPDRAERVLETFGFTFEVQPVLAVEVPCHPAGMNAIVKPLMDAEINIHYIYTTIERIGKETILILGVDDHEQAAEILKEHWIHFVGEQIYNL
ncbi:MAG: ACT domain protein [Syntrophaceae bacterium PtaB.Bin038]|nr:MAG: ACT domain protein [Syntrophaceae bacterium PtaB.Bin038]